MEGFDRKEMDENWTGRAKTRYNRRGWNLKQRKTGQVRMGVNGIEKDKHAQNEMRWLETGRDRTGKRGKRREFV